jgi:HAMP domain-containing protein
MKVSILAKLMFSFLLVGMVPLIIVGVVSLKDARKIGYGAAKDAEELGNEAVQDTTGAITELVGKSFLNIASHLSLNIQSILKERENDTLTIASMISSSDGTRNAIEQLLTAFNSGKSAEIWYNTGTDLAPREEHATIPLYSELAFINPAGMEVTKIVDGKPAAKLVNVSRPANTTFKNELYFSKTRALKNGEVYVSRLNTWYLSEEDARKDVPKDSRAWNIVPGRDSMKSGNIRFATPVFMGGQFKGIVVLSYDYRHVQGWTKHIDPALVTPVVSTSYEDNYILMFDDQGDTLVHPKPNNIRGYLEDGTLQHRNTKATPGGIFNLKEFDASMTYKEIYDKTLIDGATLVKSAVDVKGRKKMTISVPIRYTAGEYKDSGFFGGLMLSVNTDNFYQPAQATEKRIANRIKETNAEIKRATEGMQTENTILAVTLATILLVIILGLIAAGTISRPIRRLTQTANLISEANVDVEVPEIKTRDEIYDLAQSLKSVLAAVDFFREELGIKREK